MLLLVSESAGSAHYSTHWHGNKGGAVKVDIENNNIWGAMVSTLKYKLGLKSPTGSSFQKIERFLKMSKPHKPWPQKPMKPWSHKPVNPWKPITEPPPPPATTTLAPSTTTTTVPTTTTTTPAPTTTAAPTIDIDLTEDYWPFPAPIEDIDLPEGGSQVVFKPERSFFSPVRYNWQPFTPFPLSGYLRYVI